VRRPFFRGGTAAAGLAVTGAALVGCTFLVDFVTKDTPGECDGSDCLDATRADGSDDVVSDGPARDVGAPDAADGGSKDGRVDAPQCANPCRNRENGWYCGTDTLFCLAPPDDLYHCIGDATADVTHCATGAGCLQLPAGHPDTCDPCPGKQDGTYCGSDFPTVVPQTSTDKNAIYLFACQGGRISLQSKACQTGCSGTPPNAACNPN